MAYVVYDRQFQLMAKRANQRMRELEKRDIRSPAYQAVQAKMQQLGITGSAKGRRFSESGKADRNTMLQMKKALSDFLNQKTSTLRGYAEYRENVIKGLEDKYNYSEMDLSDDDMMRIFEELPDEEEDRIYYASVVVETVAAAKKQGNYDIAEIVSKLQNSKDYLSALKSLGLTISDINSVGKIEGF